MVHGDLLADLPFNEGIDALEHRHRQVIALFVLSLLRWGGAAHHVGTAFLFCLSLEGLLDFGLLVKDSRQGRVVNLFENVLFQLWVPKLLRVATYHYG